MFRVAGFAFVLVATGCATTPDTESVLGCYKLAFEPSPPWLSIEGHLVDFHTSMDVRLRDVDHPDFLPGSFRRLEPIGVQPPDAKEYIWRAADGRLLMRLGGDAGGISVDLPFDPGASELRGTAEPFLHIGEYEFKGSDITARRYPCQESNGSEKD